MIVVLRPEGDDWQVAPAVNWRRCRRLIRRRQCFAPAVFMLYRRHATGRRAGGWWHYCAEHAYGRVLLTDGIHHAYEVTPEQAAALFEEA